MAEIKRAQEIAALSLWINANVGWAFYSARQDEQAIIALRNTLWMDPNFALAHLYLGWAYEQKGMLGEAIAAFQRAVSVSGRSGDT